MKGVILAGGKGTGLYPLTKVINKHMLPVGYEPMIYNPVKQMAGAGIREIMVISGSDHIGDIIRLLGSGREFGCRFTFRVQEEALGIAHGLAQAESFAGDDKILLILGDNITTQSIRPYVQKFMDRTAGAGIMLKEVADPRRYGVAVLSEGKVIRIDEKPSCPESNYAVIGIYMYDSRVFDIIRALKPSARGEYEISDVNNVYIQKGQLYYDIFPGDWVDAGKIESWHRANEMMFRCHNQITG